MKKIALIGAGQLGSRHLQGLAKSDLEIFIEVVEPFESSRDTAKQRFEEIPSNEKIVKIDFLETISQLSDELDLVVVATNADVRYKVVKELLESKKVRNLILEKVLFQKIDEYKYVEELLTKTNTKCWVNHPRRMFPFYKNLKNQLLNSKNINFSVSGGAWGLGCNGLHFLDCFSYLSNATNVDLNSILLNKELYETKRKGFNEFNGMIIGSIDKNTFSINCFEEENSPLQFNITSDKFNILIDEANGWYRVSKKDNNWKPEIKEEKIIYFQSELTNILLNDVFHGNCVLPTYDEAMNLHIKYLDLLISHTNSFSDIKYDFCPIT
ncbi:Gfo/Idh/MocA family oxidoreductase [Aliarcobacter butzleri]|uniref:Gfo/Idh/MocA family oxidoreductase n=1 Tax=Aliarcobacter butzleri TaxID=28197 RepID=UPI0012FA4039|nr:Gfo/Idh/MocA family oxidoreductase [Aliarcobacter butzleri]